MVFLPISVAAQAVPRPDHVVIVIEENRSHKQISSFVKQHPDSYLASLMKQGASFNSFFALFHPSQPNYIELFSGDRQRVTNDNHPGRLFSPLVAPSIGGELRKKGLTFAGFAEDLPKSGFDLAASGNYVRKHCPWINFGDIPTFWSLPLTRFPAGEFEKLPTLSLVIPNLENDMHGKPLEVVFNDQKLIDDADAWLRLKLRDYVEWAQTHNSLFIVTWDEDNDVRCSLPVHQKKDCETKSPRNRIATIFVGQMVEPGKISDTQYTHLDLLRTLEEMYGLPLLGASKDAKVISDVWKKVLANRSR